MKKIFRISLFLFITQLALISCGKKENTETTVTEETSATPTEETAGNVLTIESNDQMQFTAKELKATAGEITLTLQHIGKMEKSVMGHNLVILKAGTDINAFAMKAIDAKETDYIPASEKESIIAHTKIIGGGESDTITFTIDEKGTYDFICSFPGHVSMMKGKLIVE